MKQYTVQLTEAEMKALASGMTNLLNRLEADKKSPPPEFALNVMTALSKMRAANERESIVVIPG